MQLPSFLLAFTAAPILASSYHFSPLEHSAGIAPYFTPHDPPLQSSPPQGCNVTRAAYLIRHAAIYANDFDYETYLEPLVKKLQNTSQDWSSTKTLKFLSNWSAPIDQEHVEKLTRVGLQEARSLGASVRQRYKDLKTPERIWSSTADRTAKSAQAFITGFTNNHTGLINLTQIQESKKAGADSLTPYKSCEAYSSSYGSDQSSAFGKIYTKPIIARLGAEAPRFNFTQDDITGMFELCGYETVIRGSSPFCSPTLFSSDEWLGFEYANDLMYFHNTGYGRDLSPVLGFPWVNASVAALDDKSSSQELYFSFTHREVPPTVIAALGLYNNSAYTGTNQVNETMPNNTINYNRAWKSSEILPFLTNIAIEKMSCQSYGYEEGEYYRVLNNAGPQPLVGCRDGPGGSCSKDKFHDFIEERGGSFGDYNKACEVNDLPSSLSIYVA
ncbi:putative histidine acid phosphatase [Penicillium brasilianum]|uniref:Putative histidine acid phosphatase n=1 Tax=Penicillium brasilianum TaxID=104259 RepID=A0A1S9RC44_PENBI|nr:putative histidine acid phosphatase [Penicillium brasilianum]